jgi:hypothetical protein
MNRELLERPFEAPLIKTRKGAFGQKLSYVEGAEYIRRLNAAFDGRWSFEITDHQVGKNHVVVVGKLTAGEVVKMAFGGSTITTNSTTGDVVSIADDLKAAATDAMKKAASMLGVGLHLYQDNGDAEKNAPRPASTETPGPRPGNGRGNGTREQSPPPDAAPPQDRTRPSSGNGSRQHVPLTSSQLNAIMAIARSRGLSADDLRQRSVDAFGVVPDALSKADASALITELKRLPPGDARAAS